MSVKVLNFHLIGTRVLSVAWLPLTIVMCWWLEQWKFVDTSVIVPRARRLDHCDVIASIRDVLRTAQQS